MRIRIKHKLFATLLLTSLMVAAGMFLFMQWSFDRGFLNYVNTQELEQLDQLAERLTTSYAEYGSWQYLKKNRALWRQLQDSPQTAAEATDRPGAGQVHPQFSPPPNGEHRHPPLRREGIFTGNSPPRQTEQPGYADSLLQPGPSPDTDKRPPPPPPPKFGPRIYLFDAAKQKVIGGRPEDETHLKLHPFSYQGEIIGYLGLAPAKEISEAGDLLFVEQQTESFALVALAMVALSLLLSFPMTSHLLRPIKELTAGTRMLISGRFKTRIPVSTQDELGQLSDDFNSLAMALEKNEEARQQWVADISHELRTPLAVLRGDIEALQDGVRQPDPQTLESLHGETLHLGRLVNDLYELSMSDIGALNYRKIVVDPVGILEGAIELFEPRFTQQGLKICADLVQNPAYALLADPDRLQQLFTNLLENSLRYTDAPGSLNIHMKGSRHAIVFHFQDSGPGVEAKLLPKLFDRLFRVEESRNRARGGAGLGMAICKNIVEAHSGTIGAYPAPQGGLWIKVELPLKA